MLSVSLMCFGSLMIAATPMLQSVFTHLQTLPPHRAMPAFGGKAEGRDTPDKATVSAVTAVPTTESGPYRFQRTIARADFMPASLPPITSVRWKISPFTTAVLFSSTRLASMVPLT